MNIVELKNVGKCFKGVWVLQNITLSFEKGKIHGLIGKNGSGKTMILKVIAGLSNPTIGDIFVNGAHLGEDQEIPDSLGAIIEVPGFLPNLSGFKNLQYLAGLRNVITNETIRDTMRQVGLNPDEKKHTSKYSLGMKQRLGIAQAIMENPDIVLLDEPMNGLDIQGVQDIKRLLHRLRDEGKTIILASHQREDINELCDTITKLDRGRVLEQDLHFSSRA